MSKLKLKKGGSKNPKNKGMGKGKPKKSAASAKSGKKDVKTKKVDRNAIASARLEQSLKGMSLQPHPNPGGVRKRKLSVSSQESTKSPKPKRTPSKRVSFSSELAQSVRIADIDNTMMEASEQAETTATDEQLNSSTPARSILKKRNASSVSKKKDKSAPVERESGEDEAALTSKELEPFQSTKMDKNTKLGLLITKKQKAHLKSLPKAERKGYIQSLKEKRSKYLDTAKAAKQLWEKIRSGKTKKEEKEKAIEVLRNLVRGKVHQLMRAHDTVRVIECLVSLKRQDIMDDLFNELNNREEHLISAMKSKYAKFFVLKILRNGSRAQKDEIMRLFENRVVNLAHNVFAAEVLELAYNDYAQQHQRSRIINEIYGKQFIIFRDEVLANSIEELLEKKPSCKSSVSLALREHLMYISTKPQLLHSINHRLLLDFMKICSDEQRDEMIEALKERVIEFVHTRDGARAAMHILWYSNAKDRKLLVKSLKELVVKTAKEEFGHLYLLAVLDTVDDTVLLNKFVTKELLQHLEAIVKDKYGMRLLMFLLNPRDPRFFPKEIRALFQLGDENPFSKKDASTRHKEIIGGCANSIVRYVASNMEELVFSTAESLFVAQVLQFTHEVESEDVQKGRTQCFEAIADILSREFIPCDIENQLHMVEHKNGSFLLSILLKKDKELYAAGKETLSSVLTKKLGLEKLSSFTACNKGGFALLHMFESGEPSSMDIVREVVAQEEKKLAAFSFKSAQLLLEKAKKKS